jgi:hypothetical protein
MEALPLFERYVTAHQFDSLQSDTLPTPIRSKCLAFARWSALDQKKSFSLSTLLAFVNCYAKTDTALVKRAVEAGSLDSKKLAASLAAMLAEQPGPSELRRILHTSCSLCFVSTSVARDLGENPSIFTFLSRAFDSVSEDHPSSAYDALLTAVMIIQTAFLSPKLSFDKLEALSQILSQFGRSQLARQLEIDFTLSQKIRQAAELELLDDPTLEYVCITLVNAAEQGFSEKLADRLRNVKVDRKGKGKAVEETVDEALVQAVDQVLSILPDQDPVTLREHFLHPRFRTEQGYDPEKLITAILEDDLPARFDPSDIPDEPKAVPERRNIFNEEQLDASKLRWNK